MRVVAYMFRGKTIKAGTFARVSTDDQHTENQIAMLKKAGCKRIFEEITSGGRWERPELQACLNHLREGDVLVVWKLDQLSRSLSDLLRILNAYEGGAVLLRGQILPDVVHAAAV